MAEATGRPGELAAIFAALTAQAAKDAMERWWDLVDEVESEELDERLELAQKAGSITTIEDYIGSPTRSAPPA